MLKVLILSTAILGTWLVARPAATPVAPPTTASHFVNTDSGVMQPGTRGPVIQL